MTTGWTNDYRAVGMHLIRFRNRFGFDFINLHHKIFLLSSVDSAFVVKSGTRSDPRGLRGRRRGEALVKNEGRKEAGWKAATLLLPLGRMSRGSTQSGMLVVFFCLWRADNTYRSRNQSKKWFASKRIDQKMTRSLDLSDSSLCSLLTINPKRCYCCKK